MFSKKLVGMFAVAALAIGASTGTTDAAVVKHKSTAAVRVNPGPGRGTVVKHSSTTAVRATPHNPYVGPVVTHTSRTTAVRR